MASRLGIDVGGTFTDLLLLNDTTGEIRLLKTPTTPRDQSVGILSGIEKILDQAGVPSADIGALLHGTTVSTNVVLEEKGARVGLIVTRNFEQVLHMARSQTPGPLAGWMIMIKPDPLADLERTRGVPERIDARGDIDAVAVDGAVFLLDDFAKVDTDTKMHPPLVRQRFIAFSQLLLDFVCHADRAGGRFENSQDTVAGRINHTTVMCGDSFAEDTPVVVECHDRGILVILHQARIASHIGAQDRRQPSSAIVLVRHRENPARDTMVARGKMLRLFETALKAIRR